jgi:hypothetical protein
VRTWIDLSLHWPEILDFAERLYQAKRRRDTRASSRLRAGVERDIIGAAAECAYSVFSGLPWNTEVWEKGGDAGEDFPLVDTQGTAYATGSLMVQARKKIRPEVLYVLVIVDLEGKRARIVGGIRGEALLRYPVMKELWGTPLKAPARVVMQSELVPLVKQGELW